MDINQVFRLLDAGFSKDDILKFSDMEVLETEHKTITPEQAAPSEPDADDEHKELSPSEGAGAQAVPAPEKPAEPDETDKRLTSIENSINKLVKTLQSQNIKSASFGSAGDSLEEQTDKIMASIIRPEKKG